MGEGSRPGGEREKSFSNRAPKQAGAFPRSRVPRSTFHGVAVPMETHGKSEKRCRSRLGKGEGAGRSCARKGARARFTASHHPVGSEVVFRCDEDGAEGRLVERTHPEMQSRSVGCEASCQPSLEVDAPGPRLVFPPTISIFPRTCRARYVSLPSSITRRTPLNGRGAGHAAESKEARRCV